jgi:hypothetical protein
MKDYLSIEKGISEIIHKLNKLKKTAKDVCINISVKKRGKPKRNARKTKLASKGNQYSNVYNSSNGSFNLEPAKMNKTKKMNNAKINKNKTISNESIEKIESEPVVSEPSPSIDSTGSEISDSISDTKQ